MNEWHTFQGGFQCKLPYMALYFSPGEAEEGTLVICPIGWGYQRRGGTWDDSEQR